MVYYRLRISDPHIYDLLRECESLSELNSLAGKIVELDEGEDFWQAVLDLGENTGNVRDLIDLTENMDYFDYLPGVTDDSNLGYYWIEESGCYDTKTMGALSNHIDYEGFRRDIRFDESGVPADHIIGMRYTSEDFDDDMTNKDMYNGIKEKVTDGERYYLLLDEVQEITGWEKAVNSLLENANTDIYVTGSNSKLMSSEISTYLTGRYISIPVFTLSFAEYMEFKKASGRAPKELLTEYIRMGGFPIVALSNFDEGAAYQIVEGIYNSVITSDITKRHNITNFDLFNRVVKYIVENVGKTFSANAIVKFLKSEGRSLSVESVYNYLEWLEKAFVIYRCQRYDLQGKSALKTQEKFYLTDASLKYCMMGFSPKSVVAALENIVYFELRRKGYDV